MLETFVWKSQTQNVGEIDHISVFLFTIFYWEMILHIGFPLTRIVDGEEDKTSKNSQTRLKRIQVYNEQISVYFWSQMKNFTVNIHGYNEQFFLPVQ